MIFTDIGYIATGLFALAVAALAALAVMAWRADRRDLIAVVIAPPVPGPDLLGCPTGCGDPGCAGDCTWVTPGALAAIRRRINEEDRRG